MGERTAFFPMMVFRNSSANRVRFERLADAVQLGARCPINSARDAQYQFDRPINELVFETLLEFMRVLGFLGWGSKTPAGEPTTPEKILTEEAGVVATQVPIFLAAFKLPPLSKRNSPVWAKEAVIPYLQEKYPDWHAVPALDRYLGKARGRAKAKEAIAEALRALARPDPSERRPSFR